MNLIYRRRSSRRIPARSCIFKNRWKTHYTTGSLRFLPHLRIYRKETETRRCQYDNCQNTGNRFYLPENHLSSGSLSALDGIWTHQAGYNSEAADEKTLRLFRSFVYHPLFSGAVYLHAGQLSPVCRCWIFSTGSGALLRVIFVVYGINCHSTKNPSQLFPSSYGISSPAFLQ